MTGAIFYKFGMSAPLLVVEWNSTKKWAFHVLCDIIMKLSTQMVLLVITIFRYRAITD